MWDRSGKAARDARDFAISHGLGFHADAAPALPSASDAHPFTNAKRECVVAGQWRGRVVQRFFADGATVELMALPRPLPRLQVVPTGMSRGAMDVGGFPFATGDQFFDRAFSVFTDEPAYARAFLDDTVREALLHAAFRGRALTVDGDVMYLWTNAPAQWIDAEMRFESLSVLIARIPPVVWERFDRSGRLHAAQSDGAWVPGAMQRESDAAQWTYVDLEDTVVLDEPQQAQATPAAPQSPLAGEAMFMPAPMASDDDALMFPVAPIFPG